MKTGNKLPLAMWFFGWCSFMVFCAGMGVLPAIAQTTAEGFVRLGMKHYAKGQLQEALVSFDEAIAVKPNYALLPTFILTPPEVKNRLLKSIVQRFRVSSNETPIIQGSHKIWL